MKDFSFDYAEEGETSDKNMACKYIEVCQCPEGYSGTSCEVKKLILEFNDDMKILVINFSVNRNVPKGIHVQ